MYRLRGGNIIISLKSDRVFFTELLSWHFSRFLGKNSHFKEYCLFSQVFTLLCPTPYSTVKKSYTVLSSEGLTYFTFITLPDSLNKKIIKQVIQRKSKHILHTVSCFTRFSFLTLIKLDMDLQYQKAQVDQRFVYYLFDGCSVIIFIKEKWSAFFGMLDAVSQIYPLYKSSISVSNLKTTTMYY